MECCVHAQDIGAYFNESKAQKEISRYLKQGLASHARAMLAAITASGVEGATILEAGGGIGNLSVELLKRGATRAISVEISPAYLSASQALAEQLGLKDRMEYRRADFAHDSDTIPAADIVIMHRVVCCYPDMPVLVSAAARHARRSLALSFPRDVWFTRLHIEAQAWWLRRKGITFRNYVHQPKAIVQVAADSGLRLVHQYSSGTWQIAVFER
jgi:2-polyprenyl-3-methyl-5-hydroxy-6-metoxy-1,4-benzoquinol methylase